MASLKKNKKHLSFSALRQAFSAHLNAIPDRRQQTKCIYSQHDIAMSAFACMYFQDPSLLHFQQRLEQKYQRNNLQTIFGVDNIPQDSQLRDVLDTIPSEALSPVFKDIFERLRRHKHLEEYAILPGVLMCTIDGSQYHSSKQVHCQQCLTKEHRNGEKTYSHAILQGAIMHPDKNKSSRSCQRRFKMGMAKRNRIVKVKPPSGLFKIYERLTRAKVFSSVVTG